jgi:hypothetical protein
MSVSLMLFWTAPYCQAWQNLSVINFTDATYQWNIDAKHFQLQDCKQSIQDSSLPNQSRNVAATSRHSFSCVTACPMLRKIWTGNP